MSNIGRSVHDLNSLNSLRTSAQSSERQALKAAVKEFEAYFLNLLLKNMREANKIIGEDNPLSSDDVEFFNQMHDEQLAVELSRSSQFGIGDMLFKQLSANLPSDSNKSGDKNLTLAVEQIPRTHFSVRDPMISSLLQDRLTKNQMPLNHSISMVNEKTSNNNLSNESESKSEQTNLIENASIQFDSKESFIETIKEYAIAAASKIGVHPGVLIAQAALETGWGNSRIKNTQGEESFNLFGIKADHRWEGDKVNSMTLEFEQGIPKKLNQTFRSYNSFAESFNDYIEFIESNGRYHEALEKTDSPKDYLDAIQSGGYATDPNYADKVHNIFIRENLFQINSLE